MLHAYSPGSVVDPCVPSDPRLPRLPRLPSLVSPVSYLPISPDLRRTYERLTTDVRAILRGSPGLPGLSAENGPTIDIDINANTNVGFYLLSLSPSIRGLGVVTRRRMKGEYHGYH